MNPSTYSGKRNARRINNGYGYDNDDSDAHSEGSRDDEDFSTGGGQTDPPNSTPGASNFSVYNEAHGLDYLIPFINKLQTVFRTTGINSDFIQLPQIVVVGSQSSGKSSVLESLVGKSFLPRGTGIVTRCPIVLKLIHTTSGKEWCEFLHHPRKRFHDFKEVQQEIIDQTKKIAGQSGISHEPIQLTVNSPNVVTLSVVDLPGIVKIAVEGQPDDIEKQIQDLILKYITPKNSIILAVSSANNDIATSDSIKLARKIDPQGERTLAIITKLDLATDKSEMLKVLKGTALSRVQLGVIGVINRNQEEIDKNKSFKDAVDSERKFLITEFPSVASQHGTLFLAQRLNRVLLKHIESCFPELDMRLKQLEVVYKARLEEMGHPLDLDEDERRNTLIDILTDFATSYKSQVDGTSRHIDVTQPCGGARIDHIFQVNLLQGLQQLAPRLNVTDEEIITAIRNSRQIGARLFLPEDAFQELVKVQISKMKDPVIDCADQVYHEMINMVPNCLSSAAQRFPKVNRNIAQILSEMLHSQVQHARQVLEQYVAIQSSSALTAQANFYELMEASVQKLKVNGLGKLPLDYLLKNEEDSLLHVCGSNQSLDSGFRSPNNASIPASMVFEDVDSASVSDGEDALEDTGTAGRGSQLSLQSGQVDGCKVVRDLMTAFFDIVLKQVQDYVPKSILYTMVYATVDNVGKELHKKLVTAEKVADLMKESESIVSARERVENELKILEDACKLLDDVREKSVF